MKLYAMDDRPDAPSKAAREVTEEEALDLNNPRMAMGIFRTVNDFNGPRRKEYLRAIRSWAIDIDDGSKAEQRAKLLASPLIPSEIVETKRGYQAYWHARDAQADHWNAIVLERLVPHFGADKNARDLCRILRAPGFLHLKDPADPFRVQTVHEWRVSYTERQIGEAFRWIPNRDEHDRQLADAKRAADREAREHARRAAIAAGMAPTETFWEAVWNLNAVDTLQRWSGTHWVNGEQFTFKRQTNGNSNLYVDGKCSSVFIDANGKIGSLSGGGPTPAQFCKWYGHPWPFVVEALKWAHPHLVEVDEANRKQRRAA